MQVSERDPSPMAKANPRYANGAARRKVRLYWKAQQLPCAICGRAIDYELPAGHPMSFEVDEILPYALGGSPYSIDNTQPAHRICNEQKGKKLGFTAKQPEAKAITNSRRW